MGVRVSAEWFGEIPIAPWRSDLSYVLETPSPSFGNWMAARTLQLLDFIS